MGLTTFNEGDERYFFGRDKDTRLIVADLFAAPLTLLYGASGVGKSSVIRAGVMPLLRRRDDVVAVVFAGWQSAPLDGLRKAVATELARFAPKKRARDVRTIEKLPLREGLEKGVELIERRIFVILDQFEEYSLYHPTDDEFGLQFPAAAAINDFSVTFIISLREEAVAGLDRFQNRIPTLFTNRRRVDHLDFAAARAAITCPIDMYNTDHPSEPPMSIDEELVGEVLQEVRTDSVQLTTEGRGSSAAPSTADRIEAPYLQLVMSKLWKFERENGSAKLQLDTFQSLGRAQTIVNDHLRTVMDELSDEQQDLAERVFQYLVTSSGTKIAHTARDLAGWVLIDRQEVQSVLESLSSGADRILRRVAARPEYPDEPRYEIFHDKLAKAILAWCVEHGREREVRKVKKEQVDVKKGTSPGAIELEAHGVVKPVASAVLGVIPPYKLIADLLQKGTTAVVFGSGASASGRPPGQRWAPGAPFAPTSWELAQLLANESERLPDTNRNLAEAASYYATVYDRTLLDHRLREALSSATVPAAIHKVIATIAQTRPLLILTSTFDTLVEDALAANNVDVDVIAPTAAEIDHRRPTTRKISVRDGITTVYKLFGSIASSTQDRLLITEEDEMNLFASFSAGRVPPPAIMARLVNSPVLFLGMSLSSWTQRLLVSNLRRDNRSHGGWAITRGVDIVNLRRWEASRINVYDLDLNEFAAELEKQL